MLRVGIRRCRLLFACSQCARSKGALRKNRPSSLMPLNSQECLPISVMGPSPCLSFVVKWLGASGLPVTACRTNQELFLEQTSIVIVESQLLSPTTSLPTFRELAGSHDVEVISISCSPFPHSSEASRPSHRPGETHFHLPRQLGRLIHHLRARSDLLALTDTDLLSLGSLVVNPATREVCTADGEATLTALQFDLLVILMREPGVVFSLRDLMRRLPRLQTGRQDPSVVRYHVARLRARLGVAANYIENVRGCGYRVQDALLD